MAVLSLTYLAPVACDADLITTRQGMPGDRSLLSFRVTLGSGVQELSPDTHGAGEPAL